MSSTPFEVILASSRPEPVLTNLQPTAQKPARVVVLGALGFIGGTIFRRLQAEGIDLLALDLPAFDLLAPAAAPTLAAALRPTDTLIFISAKAPCKNNAMLLDNLRMAEAVCAALRRQPVSHVIYQSSDAVYRDVREPMTEASCAEPGTLHGLMHLAREVMLKSEFPGPVTFIRPTLVYGAQDPHNGYGPNRFRRLAAEGREIVLFGEGEELRDHVFVEDLAELARLVVLHRSVGVANAVTGEIVSFRQLAEFTAARFPTRVAVKGSPRAGPMPHGGYRAFAPSAALRAFPGFRFTPWREGIARVCAQTPAS
jgi:nucleoside-diphosphate-sugar epimerase